MEKVSVKAPPKKCKTKKRKFSKPLIIFTLILQLLASCLLSLFIVIHGPFSNIRDYVIGVAMSSYSHRYIADLLFSKDQINAVLNKGRVTAQAQSLTSVKTENLSDDLVVDEITSPTNAFHGYVIQVSNPLRVHVAYTNKLGKDGELTSSMAGDHDAIAAINGGGFASGTSWTGTGAYPSDFVISGGQLIWKDDNISRSHVCQNVIALSNTGKLIVGDHSINQLEELNVSEAVTLSNYQPLIVNGVATYKNDGGFGKNPRTVIAQKADGTILLMVLDGRQLNMPGATLKDCENILINQYHAVTAANLDGGASSAMYYDGDVINKPCGSFGERTVATAFYVSK